MKLSQTPLLRTNCYRKVVISTINCDVKDQLVRKGFEIVGKVYDNIKRPKEYTLWGYKYLVSEKEKEAINVVGKQRFTQKNEVVDETGDFITVQSKTTGEIGRMPAKNFTSARYKLIRGG